MQTLRIQQIQIVFENYEKKWRPRLRKFVNAEKNVLVQVRTFLNEYKDKPNDYLLNEIDLFKLVKILINEDKCDLIEDLKKEFTNRSNSIFFQLMRGLDKLKALDQANFSYIFSLDSSNHYSLYVLIAFLNKFQFVISAANLNFLLKNYDNDEYVETRDMLLALSNAKLLQDERLAVLFLLPPYMFKYACKALILLGKKQVLDSDAFEKVLKSVAKLPSVTPSTMIKNSRKNTLAWRSEAIVDGKIHFFIEHNQSKKYLGGGQGKVKKGYDDVNGNHEISYSLKKLRPIDQSTAKREVKYQRLLGRNAFYFTHKNHPYVVSEWQHLQSIEQNPNRKMA